MLRHSAMRAMRALPRRSMVTLREPGVVGLEEDSNARETLAALYAETLRELSAMPADAAYRVNVEKITEFRKGVVEGEVDVAEIEKRLGVGQMKEIIEQAQDELELIPHMAEWAPWKLPEGAEPAKIEVID